MKNNKRFFNNKIGAAAIEQTIILLIFVMFICVVFDVILVSYRQYAVSEASNKIVRLLAVQGGSLNSHPDGYQDEEGSSYKTPTDITELVEDYLAGLNANLTGIIVENVTTGVRSDLVNGDNIKISYRDRFKVNIKYTYEWELVKNVVPGLGEVNGYTNRYSVGEFNYDEIERL